MSTTLTILSKTPTSITVRATKTSSTIATVSVGPGSTWDAIYNNAVKRESFGANQTGTFDVTLSELSPNTQYGGVAAVVGGGTGEVSNIVDATLPPPALSSASVDTVSATEATIRFTTAVDGGYLPKTIEYSLDNGTTWVTVATVTSGSATSGSFTVSSLSPGESYTMLTRVSTTAGSSNNTDITFTTEPGAVKDRIYGGVAGEELTGVTGEVRTGGSGNITAFDGSTFWATAIEDSGFKTRIEAGKLPSYLEIGSTIANNYWYCDVVFADNTRYTISDQDNIPPGPYTTAELGLTANFTVDGTDYVDLTPVYSTVGRSRLINDFYGGVSASSRLITKLYGPIQTQGITDVTGEVRTGGVGNVTAFDSSRFWDYIKNHTDILNFAEDGRTMDNLEVTYSSTNDMTEVFLNFTNSEYWVLPESYLTSYGVTATMSTTGSDFIDLTQTDGLVTRSRLIHQGFGHISYN